MLAANLFIHLSLSTAHRSLATPSARAHRPVPMFNLFSQFFFLMFYPKRCLFSAAEDFHPRKSPAVTNLSLDNLSTRTKPPAYIPPVMKTFIPLTLAAALAASGISHAQPAFSKPSGYVTQSLGKGFNLVGLTLVKPVVYAGKINSISGSVLTLASAHGLSAGKMYVAEFTASAGTNSSIVQDFNVYSGSSVTLPAAIPGLAVGDSVSIRAATTLEEIFGTSLQTGGNAAASDIVWLPATNGQYDRYYYKTPLAGTPGWFKIGQPETAASNTPVTYVDGMFVERKALTALALTITGEVKTTATNFVVQKGFNLVASLYPAGSTLASSKLSLTLKSAGNAAASDVVWIPSSPGVFARYYYKTPLSGTPSWTRISSTEVTVDGSTITLPGSVFIERKDVGSKVVSLTPPSSYSSL